MDGENLQNNQSNSQENGSGNQNPNPNPEAQAQAGNESQNQSQNQNNNNQAPATPATFEEFYQNQAEPVKALLDNHVKGLKSALESERTNRGNLEKQVKELLKNVEKGSQMETELNNLRNQLEEANLRNEFYNAAPGFQVKDVNLAFIAAKSGGFVNDKGQIDWSGLKAAHGVLFEEPKPNTPPAPNPATRSNAGAGTGSPAPRPMDMNSWIRRGAGLA